MGEVMKETRGKIDGKTVSKVLNEELKGWYIENTKCLW
jgi:Asp-tRNA(Asn)/Glu-tRNA(Gln) amidotransferase B subunit